MRSSLSVDRGASTASGGNFKVGKCDPPLPPASSAFPSPPFSLPPLHACAGAHIPGTSRACARATPPDLPFLDGPAPTDSGSPAGRASARARVVNCWPRRLSRSATELLPRRAGHAYTYGVGTLDGAGACAGRAGCWEPLAPGLGFCWGPELEGPTSPSSTSSSALEQAGQDQREVRRAPPTPTPACAPATPPAPRTDPAPSRRLAPPTRRLARVA